MADYSEESDVTNEAYQDDCSKLALLISKKAQDPESSPQGFQVYNKKGMQFHTANLNDNLYLLIAVMRNTDRSKKVFMDMHESLES